MLEWEVFTTTSEHLLASPSNTTDLYWAPSGGCGGRYDIVVSIAKRDFPHGVIAIEGYLSFNKTAALDGFRTTTQSRGFYFTANALNVQSAVRKNPPIAANTVLPAGINLCLNLITLAD